MEVPCTSQHRHGYTVRSCSFARVPSVGFLALFANVDAALPGSRRHQVVELWRRDIQLPR
jgi:hypothetical protein